MTLQFDSREVALVVHDIRGLSHWDLERLAEAVEEERTQRGGTGQTRTGYFAPVPDASFQREQMCRPPWAPSSGGDIAD